MPATFSLLTSGGRSIARILKAGGIQSSCRDRALTDCGISGEGFGGDGRCTNQHGCSPRGAEPATEAPPPEAHRVLAEHPLCDQLRMVEAQRGWALTLQARDHAPQ